MSDSALLARPSAAADIAARLGEWAQSSAPVYCRDAQGRIFLANTSFLRKFGRSLEELRSISAVQCVHPDDAAGFRAAFGRVPSSAPEPARTQRWLTPQGWRWMTWEETVLPEAAGDKPLIRAVGRDVTRHRLAEELYLKLSRAVDQSPIAIVITDAEGRAQYVNPRYIQLSGHSLEDILDRNLPVLRDGHADDAAYRAFLAEIKSGKEWRGELSRPRADGSVLWESVQVSCMRNAAGDITNLLCMREDITERRRLQDELRQAQKMESLGTLAGGIAHDFNNLLAVMNGYSEIGLLHTNDPALLQRSLREIQRAVQRASGLVRQILTFSRKGEVHFAPLDLHHLTRELVALLAETFPRTVHFELQLQDKLPALMADQNQVQQILLNLCVNARDAMPLGGVITLRTLLQPGSALQHLRHGPGQEGPVASRQYVVLEVADTGTGMTEEVRARIFEPFFTTKEVNRGTGLGLAVVYGIVASHQGFIDVESTVGVGSTFRIYLPAATEASVPIAAVGSTEFPGGTESLLVVDDEDPLRKLLNAALTSKGYRVTCACDGLEAIDFINNPDVQLDAVLLDMNMPGASGLSVLKIIRAHRPQLRVLLVSGHLNPEAREELEQFPGVDFLAKPYGLDELGRRLRKLLSP
ncbi:MAG TPA: PAS domain S-box protein [Opitutaceae bacterium]|jgi:PAS domain S-box-containing protein|nr:PAS domain S-box protein [Opitutaceae bacterium]